MPRSRGGIGCGCGSNQRDVANGLQYAYYDVVELNSVIQYIPSAGYLLDELALAMRLLAPGGALFIGDVRNLSLLQACTTGMLCADTTGTAGHGRGGA